MKEDVDEARASNVGTISRPKLEADPQHLMYCRCGYPLHPNDLETRHGKTVERWSCPERRWWNSWRHSNVWMAPREHIHP
jgi:hypothetical protein